MGTLCVKRKKSTLVDVLHIQLRNMDNQKRENIRKGAAEILLQMIRVKNQEHTATAHRDRMMCHGRSICSVYTLEIIRLADIYEQRYPALFLDLSSQMKIDSRFITREIIANAVTNFAQR